MEIERKFLVQICDIPTSSVRSTSMLQAYISRDPVIRLRRTLHPVPADNCFWLTVKGSGGLAREEFELPISEEQFVRLMEKAEPGVLRKTRYYIPLCNSLTAEADIYHGELDGFATVEVEFGDVLSAEAFTPPFWFGRDVTGDCRYSNAALSEKGLPGV